jgi:molybdopterin-guanine dinucleotide biosynthesis protein A
MGSRDLPIGVVLAGGAGRRMGGGKATVCLHDRPLLAYPVAALQVVLPEVVVVAKRDTELPPLPGVPIWTEPDEPRHSLTGIVHALAQADGRAVLVCAGDLPFATPALVRTLVRTDAGGAPAVVPRTARGLQPLLARFEPAALAPLSAALRPPSAPLGETVEALAPRPLLVEDEQLFFSVDMPEDLLTAAGLIDRGSSAELDA